MLSRRHALTVSLSLILVLASSITYAAGSLVGWGADVFVEQSKLEGIVSVSAGEMHSLAYSNLNGGRIVAFGENDFGQCNVPEPNTGFTMPAAGSFHSLGLKSDGTILAWGNNNRHQCDIPSPNSDFDWIAAGSSHSVGLKTGHSIVAWGDNVLGQCRVPPPNSGFTVVTARGNHTLARRSDNTIAAWGSNMFGESTVPSPNNFWLALAGMSHSLGFRGLFAPTSSITAWGDNSFGQCNVPAPNSGFTQAAAGGNHSLGMRGSVLVGWGDNRYGQCNVPSPTAYHTMAAGQGHSLGVTSGFTAVAWGANERSQCNVPAPNTGFVAFATGQEHHMGLRSTGVVAAWGRNGSGQCSVPAPNSGFTRLAAGDFHSLGIKTTGVVYAWGDNKNHQCEVPSPNSNFVSVSAGKQFSLGLKATGVIIPFGLNDFHQCDVPLPNSGFTAISAGWEHSLGLKTTGAVVAWGRNNYGQCSVPSGTGFTQVAAGGYHSLALRSDGSIAAWGCNTYGQCTVPAPNTNFAGIAAGLWFSVGLKRDGSIVVWGRNDFSQLRNPQPNTGFVAVGACYNQGIALKGPGTPGGALHMTLGPPGAVTAGAAWRIFGTETWHSSGDTITEMPVGMCAVEFKDIGIGKVPENVAIAIEEGETTEAFAEYDYPDVPPANMGLSPSSGDLTTTPITFAAQYADGNGSDNIRKAYLLISDSLAQSSAVCLVYDQLANKVYLKDDSGKSWSTGYAPGTDVVLENGQCLVYVKNVVISAADADLVIKWNVSLKDGFTKRLLNAYEYVQDRLGLSDGWDLVGRFYNVRPELVSISPDNGAFPIDTETTLTSLYRDANGFTDLSKCYVMIREAPIQGGFILLWYNRRTNRMYLKNDENTSWGTGYAPGTDVELENSQCIVYVKDTGVEGFGSDLRVKWAFKLKPSMAGRNLYSWMYVEDARGLYKGWSRMGTHFEPTPPVCVSLSPTTGTIYTGTPTHFICQYSDANGYSDLSRCYLQLSVTSSQSNAVFLAYDQRNDTFYLRNDTNMSWGAGIPRGHPGVLENSQCIVDVGDTTVEFSGANSLTVNWSIELKPSQGGLRLAERMFAQDREVLGSGWHVMGYIGVK